MPTVDASVKLAAQKAVRAAVRAGTLVRQPCEVCGSTVRVAGHHDDYSKPLEVRWLCARDHFIHHLNERKEAIILAETHLCPCCGRQIISQFTLCEICQTDYDLLEPIIHKGWISEHGTLTEEFNAILKRHFTHYQKKTNAKKRRPDRESGPHTLKSLRLSY